MAQIDVYIPVYMVGANGKKAYQYAKLNAVVTNAFVPEGAVCINSRAVTVVPPEKLQPPPTP